MGCSAVARGLSLPVPARDCLCLRLDPVHGLYELSPTVRRRVCEDDQPQSVALPPEDILPIGSVGLGRIEQRAVERVMPNRKCSRRLFRKRRMKHYYENVPRLGNVAVSRGPGEGSGGRR